MSSFEEVRSIVAGLWTEQLEEIADREREQAERVRELRSEHSRLQGAVRERERELDMIQRELEAMPELLGRAQLEGDEGEVLAVQGRYADARARSEAVREQLTDTRKALREFGDLRQRTSEVERSFWAHGERQQLAATVRQEFAVLRELLEDRLAHAAGPRTVSERIEAESRAARRRRDGEGPEPGLKIVGASPPPDGSGLEVVAHADGTPVERPGSGSGLVILDPGPPQRR